MKIYILGDSFADNLFKIEIDAIINGEKRDGPINKYLKLLRNENLPDPMHFGDYLELWGHEVVNLGIGGCSNESIFHQFTQIKEPFDRIIINWTGLSRFDWHLENSTVRTFTGGMDLGFKATTVDELLIEQGYFRQESTIVKNKTSDFISFFLKIYEKQKPIIWSPFEAISEMIKNEKGFIWDIKNPIFNDIIPECNKLEICQETNKKLNDRHYGRYGNFYTALVFNTILEHTNDIEHDGYYTKDLNLISKIKDRIVNAKHNIIDLKNDNI
jgi:hypothetical protein